MELSLTDEQKLVRETTERFIVDTCKLDTVRQLAETHRVHDADNLAVAAELGWFSMLVSEQRGGGSVSGEGLRDLAIVAEERGKTLQPGPFLATNIVAERLGEQDAVDETDDILQALVEGRAHAAWVMGVGAWSPGQGVTATEEAGGYRLSGEVRMVHDAPAANWLLITARDGDGCSQFMVAADAEGVVVSTDVSLDITQRFGTVRLDRVAVRKAAIVGDARAAGDDVERQLLTALILAAADTVGAADVLFSMTVEYAKDRTAFGRPIGSFQALKHQLADLSLGLEAAKAIAVEATRSVQAQSLDAGSMASIAKTWVSEMAVDLAQGCLQIFGGIGYTWEHDLHLYLRRLTVNSLLYGGPHWHRERLWALQSEVAGGGAS